MQKIDFRMFVNAIGNDFKIAIDDLFNVIETLVDDVEKLKLEAFKPNKDTARTLLEYLKCKDKKSKKNFEKVFEDRLPKHLAWLEYHCKEHSCTEEEALNSIIEG